MPVTLIDRLPLPNLKVYTAGSVSLLSIAVYYALSVTSDPNWRVNATQPRQEAMVEPGGPEPRLAQPALAPGLAANGTRNLTEQFVDVMTFMTQEPFCMWTLINIAYCSLAVFGCAVQRLVFGQLRVAEAQRVKDKFWNYVFYKFIFVFGVINVQYMDEVLLWCSWFTLVGFLHLLGQLCKDRYEYLSSSPSAAGWAHARLACLLAGILAAATALFAAAILWGLPAGRDTFAFMAAECVLVLVSALHVAARYALQLREADVAGPVAYYTHLGFDSTALVVELAHVLHMVVYSNMLVSMASLVLLMQLRHLLHELQARLRRHRLYTSLATHMSRNYPMASKEEVEKNQDNCAICWEPMKEARKLPCSHLFHNSCLCQWVQQDASCPTCRRGLAAGAGGGGGGGGGAAPPALAPAPAPAAAARGLQDALPLPLAPRHPNHLFHFDGSRYVSWLPSFSVEVTRVRAALGGAQLEAAARQLHAMFPQHAPAALAADLAATRSADLTLDNILEGRLLPAAQPTEPEAAADPPRAESRAAASVIVATAAPALASAPSPPAPAPSLAARRQPEPETSLAPSSEDVVDSIELAPLPHRFLRKVSERESLLQRRKEALIASARRRYLDKLERRAARPDTPAPAPSAAAPAPAPPRP